MKVTVLVYYNSATNPPGIDTVLAKQWFADLIQTSYMNGINCMAKTLSLDLTMFSK